MCPDYSELNSIVGWIEYPSSPLPIIGKWYLVSNDPVWDDGERGVYTGSKSGMPPFVDEGFNAIGLMHCYYKELTVVEKAWKLASDSKKYLVAVIVAISTIGIK